MRNIQSNSNQPLEVLENEDKKFYEQTKDEIMQNMKIILVKAVISTGYQIKKRHNKLCHGLHGQHPLQPHPCMIHFSTLKEIGLIGNEDKVINEANDCYSIDDYVD